MPTPPVYAVDEDGNPIYEEDGSQVIEAGEDPNVGVLQGVFQSFSDAPGGMQEELRELMFSFGAEYWYLNQFAIRGGIFMNTKPKEQESIIH